MSAQPSSAQPSTIHANAVLLQEVNQAGLWFRAKKTRPIWARQLQKSERVKTLEGEEEVPAGTFLCRGEAGDIWPQSADRLQGRYLATDDVTDGAWRKYVPRPESDGVLAARIDHPFEVTAQWGQLKGKAGDFLVKSFTDRDQVIPDDVWIVDAALFRATYDAVDDSQ